MTTFLKPKITEAVDLGAIDKRWNGIYGKFINLSNDSPYIFVEIEDEESPAIRYNTIDSAWEFTHNGEDWFIIGSDNWNDIVNKPTSTIQEIDGAVGDAHTHSNNTILDSTTEAFTTELKQSYDSKEDSSNKGEPGGYASLDNTGKLTITELPAINPVSTIVNNIAERNALTGLVNGVRAIVLDATADETVSSGAAEYIYYNEDWLKLSEVESMDLILKWSHIQNAPQSTVSEIDSAVSDSHTHTNKNIIDNFSVDEDDGTLLYDGNPLEVDVDLADYLLKPEVDGTTDQVLALDNTGNNVWKTISSTGGSGTYTNEAPVPTTIGGIEQNTTFDNVPLTAIFDMLLYPYQKPAFISFNLNNMSNTLEVGNSIPASQTFNWFVNNSVNLKENSIIIKQDGILLLEELENTGSYTIEDGASIINTTPASVVFNISATDIKENIITTNFTVSWKYKSFALSNTADILTEALIKSSIKKYDAFESSAYTASFTADNPGYKYFIVPSTQTLTTFTDTSTQLNVPFESPYTVSYTNNYDVTYTYKIYRSTNVLNGNINIRAN